MLKSVKPQTFETKARGSENLYLVVDYQSEIWLN